MRFQDCFRTGSISCRSRTSAHHTAQKEDGIIDLQHIVPDGRGSIEQLPILDHLRHELRRQKESPGRGGVLVEMRDIEVYYFIVQPFARPHRVAIS